MKFRPGVVPQWPSSRGLMCSSFSGSRSRGFSQQIDLADRKIIRGAPVGVDFPEFFRVKEDCLAQRRCLSCFVHKPIELEWGSGEIIARMAVQGSAAPHMRVASRGPYSERLRAVCRVYAAPVGGDARDNDDDRVAK